MEATTSLRQFLISKPPLLTTNPLNQISFQSLRRRQPPRIKPISANGTDGGGDRAPVQAPAEATAPEKVEVRFRKRSRRRSREESEEGLTKAAATATAREIGPKKAKKWEEMSMGEKVMEVYVGEKGLLFWLNKFAYASIFIMIGAWILFRFVGPALNLYQLDSQPLSPASIFKG